MKFKGYTSQRKCLKIYSDKKYFLTKCLMNEILHIQFLYIYKLDIVKDYIKG